MARTANDSLAREAVILHLSNRRMFRPGAWCAGMHRCLRVSTASPFGTTSPLPQSLHRSPKGPPCLRQRRLPPWSPAWRAPQRGAWVGSWCAAMSRCQRACQTFRSGQNPVPQCHSSQPHSSQPRSPRWKRRQEPMPLGRCRLDNMSPPNARDPAATRVLMPSTCCMGDCIEPSRPRSRYLEPSTLRSPYPLLGPCKGARSPRSSARPSGPGTPSHQSSMSHNGSKHQAQ